MKKLKITQQIYEEIMVQCQHNLDTDKIPIPSPFFKNP